MTRRSHFKASQSINSKAVGSVWGFEEVPTYFHFYKLCSLSVLHWWYKVITSLDKGIQCFNYAPSLNPQHAPSVRPSVRPLRGHKARRVKLIDPEAALHEHNINPIHKYYTDHCVWLVSLSCGIMLGSAGSSAILRKKKRLGTDNNSTKSSRPSSVTYSREKIPENTPTGFRSTYDWSIRSSMKISALVHFNGQTLSPGYRIPRMVCGWIFGNRI